MHLPLHADDRAELKQNGVLSARQAATLEQVFKMHGITDLSVEVRSNRVSNAATLTCNRSEGGNNSGLIVTPCPCWPGQMRGLGHASSNLCQLLRYLPVHNTCRRLHVCSCPVCRFVCEM